MIPMRGVTHCANCGTYLYDDDVYLCKSCKMDEEEERKQEEKQYLVKEIVEKVISELRDRDEDILNRLERIERRIM